MSIIKKKFIARIAKHNLKTIYVISLSLIFLMDLYRYYIYNKLINLNSDQQTNSTTQQVKQNHEVNSMNKPLDRLICHLLRHFFFIY